ncbi:DUF2207 domain-containing protein [Acidobacteria bacterium AH-259-L09]|nr:DUF2207 domain-containing protein [Acidobacteria bacterium AH-259-L09]
MFFRAWLLSIPLIFLGAPLASGPLLARSLVHESFHADIRVHPNGEIEVTEIIQTRFTGSWNGIYRFIPVDYRSPRGFSYKLRLELASITDDMGRSLRYETKRERHYVNFKIWIPGAKDATRKVVIQYRVRYALRFFEEYDEFYWNVTGDEGAVPIESASTRIQLPTDVTGLRGVAFAGPFGSVEQATQVEVAENIVTVEALRSLNMREGLTVSVVWDPGVIHRPGSLEKALFFISNNWIFAIPLLAFILMFWLWYTRGRDPRLRPIVPQYVPPGDITPAEVGTLLDNSPDLRDITATLVDLAVRGYLLIEETEKDQWFGLWSNREYRFILRKQPSDWYDLQPHERELLGAIFSDGSLQSVELSDLQNKFYKDLPAIRDQIFKRLIARRFYVTRPDKVKRRYMILAAVLAAIPFFAFTAGGDFLGQTPVSLIVAGFLSAGSIAFFGWFMPVRTLLGTRYLERILGFEEFLERVESDRFKRMIKGPEMFEKYLPFAMALGVEKNWAEAFADIYREPPDWYHGSSFRGFHTRSFVSNLNRMSTQTAAIMSSSPRSSGGSGFGGGGGGGFSGGGFGGGGTGGF